MSRVIVISAQSENGFIGKDGHLPWSVPKEYQHFLDTVSGHVMIMGRQSWDVFGGDVQTVCNIILSRNPDAVDTKDHVEVHSDLLKALESAKRFGKDIFIAGGGQIYKMALDMGVVDEVLLSTIPIVVEGDVSFPKMANHKFHLESNEDRGEYRLERWIST